MSRDFVHTVLAFTFAFLALVVGYTALARFLEPAIFGHVTNTSAHAASRLLSIGFALRLALCSLCLSSSRLTLFCC